MLTVFCAFVCFDFFPFLACCNDKQQQEAGEMGNKRVAKRNEAKMDE